MVKALTPSAFLVCGHSQYQSIVIVFTSIFVPLSYHEKKCGSERGQGNGGM